MVSRILFNTVVQAVLIFGLEKWVLTPRMEQTMGSFQYRVARRITGRHPMIQEERGWDYPPLAVVMDEVEF